MCKKVLLVIAAFATVAISCKKQEISGTNDGKVCFNVCTQIGESGSDADVKVHFGSKTASRYPLVWSNGDRIRVNGVLSDPIASGFVGKTSGQFVVSGVSAPYTIIHPGIAYNSEGRINFPSSQTHKAGSCPGASTVLSFRTSDCNSVALDNMCAYIRLNIGRGSDNTAFNRIEFYGNNSEDVAGVFNVSYDTDGHPVLGAAHSGVKKITLTGISETGEYIITLPAMTFANGFTVDIIDVNNHYMRISTDASVTFPAGKLVNAPARTYVPNGTIIGTDTPSVTDIVVHTAFEMNQDPVLNSHEGEETSASLQPMYKYSQIIPNATLEPEIYSQTGFEDQKYACYPRIKQLKDGSFIMFYHGGRYGSRIWCTRSKDFISWSTPQLLQKPILLSSPAEVAGDYRVFVNPDAVVLDNGDILMVSSYRAKNNYSKGLDGGLSFIRSTDNGKTWSEPLYVPVGSNWEPYILKLNDGTLQCYYTDAIPQTRNSGTAMITSTDGGRSWSPKIRVCQRYKYIYNTLDPDYAQYNGQVIYTDQMPCFRQLNDGSLVGWLESRMENPTPSDCADNSKYNSFCEMSMVYNASAVWEDVTDYVTPNEKPVDRALRVPKLGAGGYIVTFPSGEVLFSWTSNLTMRINIADNTARSFKSTDWKTNVTEPFSNLGFWPSMEACHVNCVALAMHTQVASLHQEFVPEDYPGLQLGMMYLNHTIDAATESITLDGNAGEWNTTQALYDSAPAGQEAILRAARDASNLYLAVEVEDNTSNSANYVHVNLGLGGTQKVNITFNKDGIYSPGTTSGVTLQVQKGKTASGKAGYVCEARVPLSLLGAASGSSVQCYMDLKVDNVLYPMAEVTSAKLTSWKNIKIK